MNMKIFEMLNQAMGLQRSSSNKQKLQVISKLKNDENNEDGIFTSLKSNLQDNGPENDFRDHVTTSDNSTYNLWMVQHPSALVAFDRIMKTVKGKRIVLFLDYDGTLSPIVEDPDRAFMSDEMRAAVREVAKYFPTAIISGRSRDKVKEFVQLSNVYYAGSHGMDIMAPARPLKSCNGKQKQHTMPMDKKGINEEVPFQPAKNFLPAIKEIFTTLEEKVMTIPGAMVEDNRFCISVHFRKVRKEDYGILEEKVKAVIKNYPEFHLTEGIKVIEIRPSIEWNKGHALEYLLETLGLSNSSEILPLYIGDDRTDEDAFKVIRSRGQGFPIVVTSTAKETKALYSLQDPTEVLTFLLRLARWRKFSSSSRSSSSSSSSTRGFIGI